MGVVVVSPVKETESVTPSVLVNRHDPQRERVLPVPAEATCAAMNYEKRVTGALMAFQA
jgi:hypothetical protein